MAVSFVDSRDDRAGRFSCAIPRHAPANSARRQRRAQMASTGGLMSLGQVASRWLPAFASLPLAVASDVPNRARSAHRVEIRTARRSRWQSHQNVARTP